MRTLSTNDFCIFEKDFIRLSVCTRLCNMGRIPNPLHEASSRIRSNVSGENGGPAFSGRPGPLTSLRESPANVRTHFPSLSVEQFNFIDVILATLSMAINVP